MADHGPVPPPALPDSWVLMKDLDGLVDRVERSFDATFGGLAWSSMVGDASPPLNVDETEDSYVVKMELPGVKREEVHVDLVGKNLNITGEIKETERKGIFRRQTRRTGRFACRVIVPSRVDAKRIEAHLTGDSSPFRYPRPTRISVVASRWCHKAGPESARFLAAIP